MSEVSSTVKIHDGMSPALKSMNKALNIVLSNFEALQRASGQSIDTASIKAARSELASAAVAMDKLEKEIAEAGNKQRQFTDEVNRSEASMVSLVKRAFGLAAAYASLNQIVGLSDKLSQTQSRIGLIVDDQGTVKAVEDKIMASANRAGAAYLETADAVSKIALRAGDAFSVEGQVDMDQVIAFTETLNKMYSIAGASAEEQQSSMLQLTQALGSGVLRGEEFNAVFEAAPNVMQAVADYMEVPIGQLRNMAAEGQITADIVKNAIFSATEQVNADFNNMSLTWESLLNIFKNHALESTQVILDKINEMANNQSVQAALMGIADAAVYVSLLILGAFEILASIGGFVYENWSFIAPVIYGVAAAMLMYYGYLLFIHTAEMISTGIKIALMLASYAHAAATGTEASATAAATAAQWGFNTALLACPVTWILLAIIAVIAAIYLIVAAINKLTGSTISATGVIMGALASAAAFVWNLFLGIADVALGVINYLYSNWAAFANFLGNIFNDPIAAIINLFGQLADNVLGILQSIANAIDKVFGSNLSSAVTGWRGGLDTKIQGAVSKYGNGSYEKVVEKLDLSTADLGLKRWSYSNAYSSGYDLGGKMSIGGVKNLLGMAAPKNTTPKMPSVPAMPSMPAAATSPKIATPKTGGSSGTGGVGGGSGKIADDIGKTANNTGKIAEKLEITDEDLKYLRDIAEKEAINRFTTAEIKIDMGGINNTVNERSDLDGIVEYLEERLYESMSIAAEGI